MKYIDYMFNYVNAALKHRFDTDLDSWQSFSESSEQLLVSNYILICKRVFQILQQRMVVTHLHKILSKLVLVKQILWAFDVILILLLEK